MLILEGGYDKMARLTMRILIWMQKLQKKSQFKK